MQLHLFGDLHSQGTDPARGTDDQYGLACSRAALAQPLQRGQCRQWQRGRFIEAQVGGFFRNPMLIDTRLFGQGCRTQTHVHAIDLVTDLEMADITALVDNHTRQVITKDRRQTSCAHRGGRHGQVIIELPVLGIHRRRMHLHQHIIGSQSGRGICLAENQLGVGPPTGGGNGFHGVTPCYSVRPQAYQRGL